jgi:DNA polymerase-1
MNLTKTWLILDVNNLCWRAFHSTGKLSFAGQGTGVIYGVLNEIRNLMDLHATSRIVFCFDHGENKRKAMSEGYKKSRAQKYLTMTPEEAEGHADLRRQIDALKKKHRPALGFKNVFYQDGYEADDVIASVVKNLPKGDEAVIVSSDKDLYQLLSPTVFMWHPVKKEMMTEESFREKWKLGPHWWPRIKAIAGCTSDDIKGVKGAGESKAAMYLRGELKKESKVRKDINAAKDTVRANLKLVKLPMEGCRVFEVEEDEVKPRAWKALTQKLGMRSMVNRVPGTVDGFGLKPRKINA